MEEGVRREDMHGNVLWQTSLRPIGSLKSTLSGKSTPRSSPSFRRLHSSRTPRREGRTNAGSFQWIRGNRLLFWLLLITLWAYLGFYVQSTWAHNNDDKKEFGGYESKSGNSVSDASQNQTSNVAENEGVLLANNVSGEGLAGGSKKTPNSMKLSVTRKRSKGSRKSRRSTTERRLRSNSKVKQKGTVESEGGELDEDIPKRNSTYGFIVGPFGKTEDSILGWNAEKRSGTCDRKGEFTRLVWSRKFVLIFHELSMTGAPLSMMELATEILSCGGTVSVVVLSRKGGLMGELNRRGIKVLDDKAGGSYKAAMKADLVVAGSAVCASWIEQYLAHFTAGSSRIVWWIMENRREYFDRSKQMLNQVKMLIFLSESQSKQWLAWCEEEHIKLTTQPSLVPLSVNDELAFVAGFPCSLNTPSLSVEKMLEKKRLLRDAVRNEMGLTDNDMLVMSLSSINAGKGQRLLLESAFMIVEQSIPLENSTIKGSFAEGNMTGISAKTNISTIGGNRDSRALFQNLNRDNQSTDGSQKVEGSTGTPNERKGTSSKLFDLVTKRKSRRTGSHVSRSKIRKLLSVNERKQQNLKVLVGSVGSKSNKALYIKGILTFLSQHTKLSEVVLWTPATTRVASLYAAADVYVINAQGLGETFGRVTIEAMAFGLPVLGTDAGGTQEIVEHNVTGLLHPLGRPGVEVLARDLQFLLHNPSVREQMGLRGRKKVEEMYLKRHMYQRLTKVFYKCMKIK